MKIIFLCKSKRRIAKLESANLDSCVLTNGEIIYYQNAVEHDGLIILFSGTIYSIGPDEFVEEYISNEYKKNGPGFLESLDGDFSMIVYDKNNEALYGAVDKFGLKSLFYSKTDEVIVFSNRIKTILSFDIIEKKPNYQKNFLFVGSHYRHIDATFEDTFYSGIHRVKQHSCIVCKSGTLQENSYWDLKLIDLSSKSKNDLKTEYMSLLRNSVSKRLLHSKNPAFMVSSGMDSSGIAALASEILGHKVTMFTTVFNEDTEYNEATEIEPLADKIAKNWHKPVIDPSDVQDIITEIINEADEPFYTVTQLMHYYLSKEVAKLGFDTLFGGLGGDEANCGEIEEYLFYFADLKYRGEEGKLLEDIDGWIKYHGTEQYPKSYSVAQKYYEKHIDFTVGGKNLLDYDRFHKYTAVFNESFYKNNFVLPQLSHPFNSYLRNKLYQDLFSEAIPCVLKAEDYSLCRFGLSARMPYFNHDVMQYGFSIPLKYKYHKGCNKALLREAMEGVLPDQTIKNCIKKGWNAPFGEWIKNFLKDNIKEIINNPTERQKEIYKIVFLRNLLDEHLSGKANHMMFFWQFLNYELWYKSNFYDV